MVIKVLKQRISEIWVLLGLSVFAYILGTILFVIIMAVDKEATTFEIATLIEAIAATMVLIITGSFSFSSDYNMAVGMGAVRKSYIPSYYLVNLIFIFAEYGIIVVSHFIESAQINMFYSSYEKEAGIEKILFTEYTIPVLLLLGAMQLVAGCCILKFGKKAFWVMWAAWMVLCIVPGRICDILEKNPHGKVANMINSIGGFFQSVSMPVVNVVIMFITVACLTAAWLMVRRQQVTEV